MRADFEKGIRRTFGDRVEAHGRCVIGRAREVERERMDVEMKTVLIATLAILAGGSEGCGGGAAGTTRPENEGRSASQPSPQGESPRPEQVHRFSDNWGSGLGCTPNGRELSLEGTIVVRPFGKGTDGALLKTSTDEWIVSYRATGTLLELRGKRVLARGRRCEKQGEAVAGAHFDLATLSALEP